MAVGEGGHRFALKIVELIRKAGLEDLDRISERRGRDHAW